MTKFYETFQFYRLLDQCKVFGFPMAIAQLCVNTHRSARYLCISSMVSGPHFALLGVIVGCSFATTFVRIYMIGPYDKLISRLPASVNIDQYIDDTGLNSVGKAKEVVRNIKESSAALYQMFVTELGCE
eukprot:6947828-Pyramimonas_sp.AAC.1